MKKKKPVGRPRNIVDKDAIEVYGEVQSIFKNEKQMCDIFEKDISLFMRDVFSEEYISHKREYGFFETGVSKIKGNQYIFKRGSRIDFVVETRSGTAYGIEVKNYTRGTNLTVALGQLFGYGALFYKKEERELRLVLLTSDIDIITADTIGMYNLPIEMALLRKEGMYLLKKGNE